MGVLVSPAQRMTALNMLVPRVKGMAQAMIRKYREASPRTAGSAPSRAGSGKERANPTAPMRTPKRTVKRRLCHTTRRASSPRPAPRCWATCTEKPMAAAAKNPLNSQVVLAVRPTAAVA